MGDSELLETIHIAADKAMRFSSLVDFANPSHHREAIELHRYVLRLIGHYYCFIRIQGEEIDLERSLKSLFVTHQDYLRAHQEAVMIICA